MFLYLAGTSSDFSDAYHFIKKVQLTSNSFTNCMNVLVGVGAVFTSFLTKQNYDSQIKMKLLHKLLFLMREVDFIDFVVW